MQLKVSVVESRVGNCGVEFTNGMKRKYSVGNSMK